MFTPAAADRAYKPAGPPTAETPIMAGPLHQLFRELHRLRKHVRDLQAEIDRGPRVLKAHQQKIAGQEQALVDARDAVKRHKIELAERELQMKTSGQNLAKHVKQLDDLTASNQIDAKTNDINTLKASIAQLEEDILTRMGELEEKTAQIPALEEQLKKFKADLATYEVEAAGRMKRLKDDLAASQKQLVAAEAKMTPEAKPLYDRLVKAHGAEALAGVANKVCTNCRMTITPQGLADLTSDRFAMCPSCGRLLYMVE